jgi:ArsR family metal-binding transcriptional regulator
MLIQGYQLELISPPCAPGTERWSAFARLEDDIREVLPYLNAVWAGAIYDHAAGNLTWQTGGRAISVRPRELAVSNLADKDEAGAVVARLVTQINDVWERRATLTASTRRRERLRALDVYKLLPGGNCKACGEPTCFIFANKLAAGQVAVEACTRLFTDEHREKRVQLLDLLAAAA